MTEKKSIFDKAVDALTNRDEKAELEQAKMAADTASKEAAALRAKIAADKVKADAAKVAADRLAASKAAADKAAAERVAAAAKVMKDRAEAAKAAQPKKGIVTTRSLRVRKDHDTSAAVVEGLDEGKEVQILETWTDGKNTWAKIGPDKWAAMIYDGQTLMKFA
jgi:hypothetical protein